MSNAVIYYGMHLRGVSHIEKDLPCQDYHKCVKLDNGWILAAIADGVGSAKYSERGSKKRDCLRNKKLHSKTQKSFRATSTVGNRRRVK